MSDSHVESAAFALIAHRGLSASRPENTVAAFSAALQQGFWHIETDCQLSADGVPVIIHGEQLHRTTDGAGAVSSFSAAELRRLDAGSWFAAEYAGQRIPLLTEVLALLAEAHLHLELKSAQPELPAKVAEALRAAGRAEPAGACAGAPACRADAQAGDAFGVPGITITSFHLDQLRRSMRELDGGVLELAAETAAAVGAPPLQLCPRANACTAERVAAARTAGHSVRGWGVRSLEVPPAAAGGLGAAWAW